MIVRGGVEADLPGFLALAGEVEHWFGPMVEDAGFHRAVRRHIERSMAFVAVSGPEVLGGLLFGTDEAATGETASDQAAPDEANGPTYHVHWLVVTGRSRGGGVGRALLAEATRRYVRTPGRMEVVTFGPDHPGAVASGARVFYERLGFVPGEEAEAGPEGGSRQVFHRAVG